MKCDICDKEFANSVELEQHMEREHPLSDGDGDLEEPDNLREKTQDAPVDPGKNA